MIKRPSTWTLVWASVVALLLVILVRIGLHELGRHRYYQTYSSIASTTADLGFSSLLADLEIRSGPDWRLLAASEYNRVIAELARRRLLDVGWGKVIEGRGLVDPWGNEYRVAICAGPTNSTRVVVWSLGSDRKSGTADDIFCPEANRNVVPAALLEQ